MIVTPSAVKELKELKTAVMTLGGHMVQEWTNECDYVIMESLSLTVKVACALLAAKYIVTPDFFQDMLQCAKTKKPYPNPNNYLPTIAEKHIEGQTFEPISVRSQLFDGKIFVFASPKHLKKLEQAVLAGGI